MSALIRLFPQVSTKDELSPNNGASRGLSQLAERDVSYSNSEEQGDGVDEMAPRTTHDEDYRELVGMMRGQADINRQIVEALNKKSPWGPTVVMGALMMVGTAAGWVLNSGVVVGGKAEQLAVTAKQLEEAKSDIEQLKTTLGLTRERIFTLENLNKVRDEQDRKRR